MQLTANFKLSEFTKSQSAVRLGLDNTPDKLAIFNLQSLCEHILQPLRERTGPLIITSGYRSPAVNKAIGGSATSRHCLGQCADLESPSLSNIQLAYIILTYLEFDQLILEFYSKEDPSAGWVHVGYSLNNNRNEVLTASKVDNKTVYSLGLPSANP